MRASSLGRTVSQEVRAKISAALVGHACPPRSLATRHKQSIAKKGKKRPPFSDEWKANLSASHKNPSLETRAKMSAAHKGRSPSPEHRAAIGAGNKGKVISAEDRAKISAAMLGNKNGLGSRGCTGQKFSAEWCAKIGASKRGKKRGKFSDEWLGRISAALKGRSLSPEHRAAIGAGNKGRVFSLDSRARMSESRSRGILDGSISLPPRSKHGWFDSEKNGRCYHYRSSWELGWCQYLEDAKNVRAFWVEPFALPYTMVDGSLHRYHPDFLVEYMDGSLELLEIRPEYRRNDPKSLAKFSAGREWCSKHERTAFRVMGRV
jgi:plasmid stability protein